SRRRQARERRCLNRDPAAAALVRQREVPGERGTRLQHDDIAWLRIVEGRLQVPAGGDRNCLARWGNKGRIDRLLWKLRRCRGGRTRQRERSDEKKHREQDEHP